MHGRLVRDLTLVKVFVLIEWIESLWEVIVWWAMSLLEVSVFHASARLAAEQSSVIEHGEHSVVGNNVVVSGWLVVVQVSKFGGTASSKQEWQLSVSVIDSVHFMSVQELKQVVLDDWVLAHGSDLSSRGVSSNAVTKGKHIFESCVLKSVLVNIHHAVSVGQA